MSKTYAKDLKVAYLASKAGLKLGPKRFVAAYLVAGAAGGLLGSIPTPAQAFNIYDGAMSDNNLQINLNTTISYTGIVRTNNPSKVLTGADNINGSEGDINFAHGLASNEFEVVPILDITDGFTAHISAVKPMSTQAILERTKIASPIR